MNISSQKQLQTQFDQMQRDHPLGGMAVRFVEQAMKKHPPPNYEEKKKPRKRRTTKSTRKWNRDFSSDSSMIE